MGPRSNPTLAVHLLPPPAAMSLPPPNRPKELDWQGDEVSREDNKLGWACQNGHEQAVQHWYEQGGEINFACKEKMTHLHRVGGSYDDHPANAIFLLDKGSEIDALDLQERTPLHWAITRGHLEVVRVFIEAGAQIETKDKGGNDPLSLAKDLVVAKDAIAGRDCLSKNQKKKEEKEHRDAHAILELLRELLKSTSGEAPAAPVTPTPVTPTPASDSGADMSTPKTAMPKTPNTPAARVAALEMAMHDSVQDGGLMKRLGDLECALLGVSQTGAVPGRLAELEAAMEC